MYPLFEQLSKAQQVFCVDFRVFNEILLQHKLSHARFAARRYLLLQQYRAEMFMLNDMLTPVEICAERLKAAETEVGLMGAG